MSENKAIKLSAFLEMFPEVKLPITLTDESQRIFSASNEPFNQAMVEQYLIPLEDGEIDEFTEFVPCFRIPETYDFHAIVYWKAELLQYQYVLVTFAKDGQFIDKRIIAGTFYDGKALTTSVATIDEEWEILIVSGQSAGGENYDPQSSRHQRLEILPEGQIVGEDE
jgi:hypothetical protein